MIMEFRVVDVIQQIQGAEHRAMVRLIADKNSGVLMELTGPMSELAHLQEGGKCELGVS
jgi:hypothetical protein